MSLKEGKKRSSSSRSKSSRKNSSKSSIQQCWKILMLIYILALFRFQKKRNQNLNNILVHLRRRQRLPL